MERAVFLVEDTGIRLPCLLNPESLVMRRLAGITRRQGISGPLSLAGHADDPLLYTGGGSTELTLDLLFDVTLAGASIATDDVRGLTGPLWQLAENQFGDDGFGRPPLVRFVWGKSWNVPGIVAAVAERLEYFTEGGTPRRSWLRMRLLRVSEEVAGGAPVRPMAVGMPSTSPRVEGPVLSEDRVVQIVGGASMGGESGRAAGSSSMRLDEVAYRFLGDASLWRIIATVNAVADPLRIQAGLLLRIPSRVVERGTP